MQKQSLKIFFYYAVGALLLAALYTGIAAGTDMVQRGQTSQLPVLPLIMIFSAFPFGQIFALTGALLLSALHTQLLGRHPFQASFKIVFLSALGGVLFASLIFGDPFTAIGGAGVFALTAMLIQRKKLNGAKE